LIVRSSDELIGNKDYFKEMYNMLDDPNVIKTCYEYFKAIPDLENFHKHEIPRGEYQRNLQDMTTCPIEQWLEEFTLDNINETEIEISSKEVLKQFRQFCTEHEIKYEVTSLKLGLMLTNKKIDGVEKGGKTRDGNTKKFNIAKLKERFIKEPIRDLEEEARKIQKLKDREEMKIKESKDREIGLLHGTERARERLRAETMRRQSVGFLGNDIKTSLYGQKENKTQVQYGEPQQVEETNTPPDSLNKKTDDEYDQHGVNLEDDEEEFEQAKREEEEREVYEYEKRKQAESIAQYEESIMLMLK
jgi:hypothetical protein